MRKRKNDAIGWNLSLAKTTRLLLHVTELFTWRAKSHKCGRRFPRHFETACAQLQLLDINHSQRISRLTANSVTMSTAELSSAYAALILADDGIEITV